MFSNRIINVQTIKTRISPEKDFEIINRKSSASWVEPRNRFSTPSHNFHEGVRSSTWKVLTVESTRQEIHIVVPVFYCIQQNVPLVCEQRIHKGHQQVVLSEGISKKSKWRRIIHAAFIVHSSLTRLVYLQQEAQKRKYDLRADLRKELSQQRISNLPASFNPCKIVINNFLPSQPTSSPTPGTPSRVTTILLSP